MSAHEAPSAEDEPRCYGCEHCGCDPNDPDDYCEVCDDCPDDIEGDDDDWF